MPHDIHQRYIARGHAYYFKDGGRAFVDRGERLTTRWENAEVISALVTIAKAREWGEITVSGTRRFQQEVWIAARLADLEVRGYAPEPSEEARLDREIARCIAPAVRATPKDIPEESTERPDTSLPRNSKRSEEPRRWLGHLVDHGPAPYQHKSKAEASYFIRVETPEGTKEVWGVDLGRAVRESLSRPERGDEVVVRCVGKDSVTVRSVERDMDGNVVKEAPLATHRNRWVVEKKDFLNARAEAAQVVRNAAVSATAATARHPELAGTYLQLRAAEAAASGLHDPRDRAQFVDIVRKALADAIARGDPMPSMDVRDRVPTPSPPGVRAADQAQTPEHQ